MLLEKFSEVLDEEKRNKLKKMVNYRSSLGNTIGLFLDKDYYPNGLYRRTRYKIMVLLRTL